jgi:hypothetical protein
MTSRGILDFHTIFGRRRRPLAFFFLFSEPLVLLPVSIVAFHFTLASYRFFPSKTWTARRYLG